MADPLSIGTSALLAIQRSLSTVSHNISNATVEGYSRQRTELGTRVPEFSGVGFVGTGVQVQDVSRFYDQFAVSELRTNSSTFNQFEQFHNLTAQVDNLLADPVAGLTPVLQDFFNAVQEVADDPASNTNRQVLLTEADSLVQRFENLDSQLSRLADSTNQQVRDTVNEINGLADAIAQINDDITRRGLLTGNQEPNDLLDQRDRLVLRLTELVSVSTVEQDDGALNVFIGSGQSLVIGTGVSTLNAVRSPFDSTRVEISISQGTVSNNITSQLTGGQLGGTLDFRERILEPAINSLGRTAIALADSFNAQHNLGLDLNGNFGGNFFNVAPIGVIASSSNTTFVGVTATLQDSSQLTTSDYTLSYDGLSYTVLREEDNQVVFTSAVPFTTTIDGFDLTSAALVAGDSFRIRPTEAGASGIASLINDTDLIAAAGPLRATAELANLGDVEISLGPVTDVAPLPLGSPAGDIALTFNPDALGVGVPGFDVTVGGAPFGAPLAYDPATEVAGKSFTLGAPYTGVSFTVSGIPVASDVLTIADNIGGVSDNNNALLLSDLQNQVTIADNNTYQSAYGQLVADVGVSTRQAEVTRDAQDVLLRQAVERRESVSGVNLDEEAADLIRFQQAYQAAAQVISTADSLFQELIGVVRRA